MLYPIDGTLQVARTILEHRQRNRIKFMIKKLGWDRFVEEYQKALGDAMKGGNLFNIPNAFGGAVVMVLRATVNVAVRRTGFFTVIFTDLVARWPWLSVTVRVAALPSPTFRRLTTPINPRRARLRLMKQRRSGSCRRPSGYGRWATDRKSVV